MEGRKSVERAEIEVKALVRVTLRVLYAVQR